MENLGMFEVVTLKRFCENAQGTFGVLLYKNTILAYTLERPWLNNLRSKSCIPIGTYWVQKYSGTRHKNAFWVDAVPDRSDILIHEGNTLANTIGCILVGTSTCASGLLKSQAALDTLNVVLPFKFQLRIEDVRHVVS